MTGVAGSWRAANAGWLALALERLRLRLNRRALWLQRTMPDRIPAADWLLAADCAEREKQFHATDAGSGALGEVVSTLDAGLADHERRMRDTGPPPAMRMLAELAALTPFEADVLLLAAAPALDPAFARAYAELHQDPRRDHATLYLALALEFDDPIDRVLAQDALLPGGPLRGVHLVEVEEGGPLPACRLGVDERIADYLRGLNRADGRLVGVLADLAAGLASERIERLAAGVAGAVAGSSRWSTVNLIGTLEGGAGDVAARACGAHGLHAQRLDIQALGAYDLGARERLFALLGREALLGGLALVLDADGAEPELVDAVIERVAATLFVVSAERWPIDQAAEVVRVDWPARPEQRVLWHEALAEQAVAVNGAVDSIVEQFDFGPPAIAAAVARAAQRGAITGPALWSACREQSGASIDALARRITPCYGWEDIVVTPDVRAQLREVADQVRQRARVYEAWGFGAQLGRGRGITALFAGPSGTGKTMAAEILGGHLELDLYRVDLAGIVSKYVGETEKNLRRVFDAAERSGSILFFDEADALFGSRTEVRDSHDRYANVEIDYLLQRMEDYAGLAILATNRRSALDTAFLRRLRFVIDFPFPSAEDRRRIWERVFPAPAEVDELEYAFLSKLEIAGGSIRSIAINAAFLAAAEHAAIGMPHVVRATAREYAKLSKPISAAEFGDYHAVAIP